MTNFFKTYKEQHKQIKLMEEIIIVILFVAFVCSLFAGLININKKIVSVEYIGSVEMKTTQSYEDFDSDYTFCDIEYTDGVDTFIVQYSYEELQLLNNNTITAYKYITSDEVKLFFTQQDVSMEQMQQYYQQVQANNSISIFNLVSSLLILIVSLLVVYFFSSFFSTYEKIWFMSIMILATIFAVLFPEESANGVNGIIIMLLYLLDTFFNILCELLISKQSRYNFLVSILVEITEIVICIVLMYRFATMAVTLFFWLPIDIMSFINWTKHKDNQQQELTVVRKLKGYQEVLVLVAIALWTIVVGYFISGLDIATDFYHNQILETIIIYIDACASAVGVANGIFIFLRLEEQWIAWYLCSLLEAIINILSGQYVLLVLKLGYFTNTTYGFIKWNRYIKTHNA